MASTNTQQGTFSPLWDEPEPLQAEPKEHIDADCLPKMLSNIAQAIAESLSVSFDMVAATSLGIMSVCCNKHSVCLKDGWIQPLTLFTVGCAEAGERKSPVINALKKPIDDWVRQKNIDLKPRIAESKQRYKNLKSNLHVAEKALEKGKGDEAETIRLAKEIDDYEPVRQIRLYSGDVTSEKLAQLLQENEERFAIISSEGGILQVLSGERYGSGTANYDVYCQAYNGETVNVDRVNSGTVTMESPVLSMVLFVQPVILAGLLGNDTLQGVGLVDRCLFYAPKSTIGSERFATVPVNPKIETAYSNLIHRLLDEPQRRTLRLSDEAKEMYGAWYDQFTRDIPFLYDDLRGWASKFRGTVGRIAGIIQICEGDVDLISGETMYKAILLADYFAEQARLILRTGGLNKNEQAASYILGRIKALRKETRVDDAGRIVLTYRNLRRNTHRKDLQKKSDFNEPLQVLIDKGYIDLNGDDFDRVTEIYINPSIWG